MPQISDQGWLIVGFVYAFLFISVCTQTTYIMVLKKNSMKTPENLEFFGDLL